MSLFIESIRIHDGKIENLGKHQERVSRTLEAFFPEHSLWSLKQRLSQERIPSLGTYKCRVLYGSKPFSVGIMRYTLPSISSLQLVDVENVEYAFKSEDRSQLDALFSKRNTADDILIVQQGLITDSYYANVAFLEKGVWVTPKKPLLLGTRRAKLLEEGVIIQDDIAVDQLGQYEEVSLFNAMIPLESIRIPIKKILR